MPLINFYSPRYECVPALVFYNKGEAKAVGQQQAALSAQLAQGYAAQFADQKRILSFLEAAFKPLIESPSGFLPGEEAAMRTSATEQITGEYGAAGEKFREQAFMYGGRELPSGAMLQGMGSIEAGRAATESGAQRNITMIGSERKRQNMFNAAAILSGNAQMMNPLGYAGASTGAAGAATRAYEVAGNTWWSRALTGFTSGLGSALGGSLFTAGRGTPGGCWILTALYGKDMLPTRVLWGWMTNPDEGWSQRSFIGKQTVRLYYAVGEQVADLVRQYRPVRFVLKSVFDYTLRRHAKPWALKRLAKTW